jgi:hypothetical protein
MLLVLFGFSISVIIASILRRPDALWQRVMLLVAVMTLVAVGVAWGMELWLGTE